MGARAFQSAKHQLSFPKNSSEGNEVCQGVGRKLARDGVNERGSCLGSMKNRRFRTSAHTATVAHKNEPVLTFTQHVACTDDAAHQLAGRQRHYLQKAVQRDVGSESSDPGISDIWNCDSS